MNPYIDEELYLYYEKYPLNLVDVGACGGIKNTWQGLEKFTRLIGFEPDEEEYDKLTKQNKKNNIYYKIAVHSHKEKLNFHIMRKQQLSSIFEPDRSIIDKFPDKQRWDILKTIQLETDSLDNILLADKLNDIDAVKIDTQGSGLYILKGGEKTLSRTFAVEIEVEFMPIYKNQTLFADIDIFMRAQGFELFDLRPWYWKREAGKQYGMPKGQIIFSDALYFKSNNNLSDIIKTTDDEIKRKSKLLKAISISSHFGYMDYAFEILETNKSILKELEKDRVFNFIKNSVLWRSGGKSLGNLEFAEEA